MPAACIAFTIDLNSCTCWPSSPVAAYVACGAKKARVL